MKLAGCITVFERRGELLLFLKRHVKFYSNFKYSQRYASEKPTQIIQQSSSQFVPAASEASPETISQVANALKKINKLFVLTGAGISTESGIPDYRSEGVGQYARSNHRPVQYADFLKSYIIRKHYWARNYVAWPLFSSFLPHKGHKILAEWEKRGLVDWLVTQNVDGLHYKAGSEAVTELHGSSHRVMCIKCSFRFSRIEMQNLLDYYNPHWSAESMEIAPDGDVKLTHDQLQGFQLAECPGCGQDTLKPEVVFFGDNVSRNIVDFVFSKVSQCDHMLVVGSSLEVYSGYRFVLRASDERKPVTIINIGNGRADKLADILVSGKCGNILVTLNEMIFQNFRF